MNYHVVAISQINLLKEQKRLIKELKEDIKVLEGMLEDTNDKIEIDSLTNSLYHAKAQIISSEQVANHYDLIRKQAFN